MGSPGNDTAEQDDGNTVAHTELGDLLAQPHQEGGAGGEGKDDDESGPQAVSHQFVVADELVVAKGLKQGDGHSGVASDGGDLLLALLALVPSHLLQSGDGDGQQLHNDGAVDIGLDGQSEDGSLSKGVAAHDIEQTKDTGRLRGHVGLQRFGINEGDGNGRTNPENQQSKDGKQQLVAQLLHLPGTTDGLNHVRSPPLYRLPFRSSLSRRRRTRKHAR